MTLKFVSESRVTWATYVPILVFLGISVFELGSMCATGVRQTDRQTSDKSIDFLRPFIMIYSYALRQHIKYNGAQLKHRYKIYGRQTI